MSQHHPAGSSGHCEIAKRTRGSTGSTPLIHPSERQKCHHQEPRKRLRCADTELSPMSRDITRPSPTAKVCTLCTPPNSPFYAPRNATRAPPPEGTRIFFALELRTALLRPWLLNFMAAASSTPSHERGQHPHDPSENVATHVADTELPCQPDPHPHGQIVRYRQLDNGSRSGGKSSSFMTRCS
jgi:hypothetical protein